MGSGREVNLGMEFNSCVGGCVFVCEACVILLLFSELSAILFIFQEIRKGLLKAAKTTGAWIFTGGTNTGKPIIFKI